MKGLGVMIQELSGNKDTVEAVKACLGKRISKVQLKDDKAHLTFEDGDQLSLWDNGQSCCESRYMVCDDELSQFTGATFLSASIKDGPNVDDQYGDHEVQFLELSTDRGAITFANHNEHNGYYGGFSIQAARRNEP